MVVLATAEVTNDKTKQLHISTSMTLDDNRQCLYIYCRVERKWDKFLQARKLREGNRLHRLVSVTHLPNLKIHVPTTGFSALLDRLCTFVFITIVELLCVPFLFPTLFLLCYWLQEKKKRRSSRFWSSFTSLIFLTSLGHDVRAASQPPSILQPSLLTFG